MREKLFRYYLKRKPLISFRTQPDAPALQKKNSSNTCANLFWAVQVIFVLNTSLKLSVRSVRKRNPQTYPWSDSNFLTPLVLLWLLGWGHCQALRPVAGPASPSLGAASALPEFTEWSSVGFSRNFHLFPIPCRAAFLDPLSTSEFHSGGRR